MITKISKGFKIALMLLLLFLLGAWGYFYTEGKVIDARKTKAAELRNYLADFERNKKTLLNIEKDLGPPLETLYEHGVIDGNRIDKVYKYRYEFRAFPWSEAYYVWLEIRFDQYGTVADYTILQSFG